MSLQIDPAHGACFPPCFLLHHVPESCRLVCSFEEGARAPVHLRDNALSISAEFDMNPVGFMTGQPFDGPCGASAPYWH